MHAKKTPTKRPDKTVAAARLIATPDMYRRAMQGTSLVPITSGERLKDAFLQEIAAGQYCTSKGYSECQCRVLREAAEAMENADSNVWARYVTYYIGRMATVMKIGYSEAQELLLMDFSVCMAWISRAIFGHEPWLLEAFAGNDPA